MNIQQTIITAEYRLSDTRLNISLLDSYRHEVVIFSDQTMTVTQNQ